MLDRVNRVFIRSFGCPRQPGVGTERPTSSAEAARGDPPLLPDFQPTDQIKVTRCCVLTHSMRSPGLSMLYHVYSHRGRIDSVISGAFPGNSRCVLTPGSALRPSQGPKNAHSAHIYVSDQETSVDCITSSVPGRNPSQHRVVWLVAQEMSTAHSAAPRDRPRGSRHPAQSSAWVVPCTCNPHRNCSPPMRAARAQATWSLNPAWQNQAPRGRDAPLPARAAPFHSAFCFTCVVDETPPVQTRGRAARSPTAVAEVSRALGC
jgi:hypothetical protein